MAPLFKEYGCIALLAGNTGCQMGGWFRKEIKSVADLKGLKFRIGGMAGLVLAKLGVVPQLIGAPDIYPALEKGTIDAAEWVGPYDDEKLGFNKVAKNYYYPGFWEGGPMLMTLINEKKWNELPKPYQAALTAACGEANSWMPAKYDEQNPQALRRLIASGTNSRRRASTGRPFIRSGRNSATSSSCGSASPNRPTTTIRLPLSSAPGSRSSGERRQLQCKPRFGGVCFLGALPVIS